MLRAMTSAIGALRNHQMFMDVVANNISNVNTVGFKASRVSFQDALSQTIRDGLAPQGGRGGVNGVQVGSGMMLGAVSTSFTQGAIQETGIPTNIAIQGEGFLMLDTGDGNVFTRDGNLSIGLDGTLLSANTGMAVLGWAPDANGVINAEGALGPITIPFGDTVARATTNLNVQGTLDASAEVGDTVTMEVDVYDSLGNTHSIEVVYEKTGNNQWSWTVPANDGNAAATTGTITFDANGNVDTMNPAAPSFNVTFPETGAAQTVALNLGEISQLADSATGVTLASQDGLPAGTLSAFAVTGNGEVVAAYTNGLTRTVGKIALATFSNPGGLQKLGQNVLAESVTSGNMIVGEAGTGNRGALIGGALEGSNVELAQQFTDMIVAERGFQANSRIITAADEMLQELVNLKR